MKQTKRWTAWLLVAALFTTLLAGCSFTQESDSAPEEDDTPQIEAVEGGSISWPEGLDTSLRFTTGTNEDGTVLYAVFNNVQNRFTGYFTPGSDTITMTSYATTESPSINTYQLTLWKEGYGGREYQDGYTAVYSTSGECQTAQFTGLEPGVRYKIGISFLSGVYYISGGLMVEGLTSAESVEEG